MTEYNIHTAFKTRELFGIQLEVTSLLLNTEMLKLSSLKTELEFCKNNKNFHPQLIMYQEDQQLQLIYAISRIQAQVDQLEREYTSRALGLLKSAPLRRFGKVCKKI